jgi:hypothetical protein
VSFRREDGTAFAMNNRYSTTQLVVVMFGPAIQPGFGAPIRKGDEVSAAPEARTPRHDNPDWIEFDETATDDIRTVECPFCGRRFPV